MRCKVASVRGKVKSLKCWKFMKVATLVSARISEAKWQHLSLSSLSAFNRWRNISFYNCVLNSKMAYHTLLGKILLTEFMESFIS